MLLSESLCRAIFTTACHNRHVVHSDFTSNSKGLVGTKVSMNGGRAVTPSATPKGKGIKPFAIAAV